MSNKEFFYVLTAIIISFQMVCFSAESNSQFSFGAVLTDPEYKAAHTIKLPEVKSRAYFDWRDHGAVTASENQGACGSCWAFALTGVMESAIYLQHGYLFDLSEQYILSCGSGYYSWGGCCGATTNMYEFYVDHNPVLESYFPFGDGGTSCPPDNTNVTCTWSFPDVNVGAVADSFFFVDEQDPTQVMSLLLNHGPSFFSFRVHSDFLTYWSAPAGTAPWTDGVYVNTQNSFEGNHAVLITGYDSQAGYWICKNSWGQNGGPFGNGSFKYAWSGHTIENLWEIGSYLIEGVPDTPIPSTITPTPTFTPRPPENDRCPGVMIFPDDCHCDNTLNALDDFQCGITGTGTDVVYHLSGLQEDAVYLFKVEADYNADFAIASVCDDSTADVMCKTKKNPYIAPSCSTITEPNSSGYATMQWTAEQNEYWIWIDSTGSAWGDYCFEVITVRTPTPTPTAQSLVINVPADYSSISAAIQAADHGDTVLVADGTYSGVNNRNLFFDGKEILVTSVNGPDSCIIDCESARRAVLFTSGESYSSRFSGFTVKNGYSSYGGAVSIEDSSPLIGNCIFLDNISTSDGGAVYCSGSSAKLVDCIFQDNHAGDDGGGLFLTDSSVNISNCLIYSNFATDLGGGVFCENYSSPNILNSTFYRNETDNEGGGIVAMTNCSPQATSCIFWQNQPQQIYLVGGSISVTYSDVDEGYAGTGNIYVNPVFVTGSGGVCYLDATLSSCFNQGHTSAENVCFDTEDDYLCLNSYTTRNDEIPDNGIVDLGFHHRITAISTPTSTPTPEATSNPGEIWVPDDYADIKSAVAAAQSGETVIVRDGIYDGVNNRNICFSGKAITVKSENGPENCILDGELSDLFFYFNNGETNNSVLQGLTFRNGLSGSCGGGAIVIISASPLITGCVFESNYSTRGGGAVFVTHSGRPVFSNCEFYDNQAINGTDGGAMLLNPVEKTAVLTVINCIFKGNSAEEGGAIKLAGGYQTPLLLMTNCTLTANTADSGPELYCSMATINMRNCIVWNIVTYPPIVSIDSSDIVTYSDVSMVSGTYPGTGNINQNPSFVSGYRGLCYLSSSSPCVDSGAEFAGDVCFLTQDGGVACMTDFSTAIDGSLDQGKTDMGFHYQQYAPVIHRVPSEFSTLQAAIDHAVDFDIVLAADDIYTGAGNKNLDFGGKSITLRSENGPDNCIIDCQGIGRGIRFVSWEDAHSVFDGFTIRNGGSVNQGGAVFCQFSSPVISNCRFSYNSADDVGGAVYSEESGMRLTNVIFEHNSANDSGGALYCLESSDSFNNCLFERNFATNDGGAVLCDDFASPEFHNCTFYANETDNGIGGAIAAYNGADSSADNSVFFADQPNEFRVVTATINVSYSNVYEGWPGTGNINANPRFTAGPLGNFYLDTTAKYISPCIDAGTGTAGSVCYASGSGDVCMGDLTTRIDAQNDSGSVDMGYHYRCETGDPTPTPPPYYTPTPAPKIIRVPSEYPSIQQAINAADNLDAVLVACGTYTGPLNTNLDTLNKQIRIISEAGPVTTIIDCENSARGFFIHSGEGQSTVIQGFTIQNGWIESGKWPAAGGGAILCVDSDPEISNCILKWNHAMYGGAVMMHNSQMNLINCLIVSNGLLEQNNGGGVYCSDSQPVIQSCTIYGNEAQGTFTGQGGGIFGSGSDIQISETIIWNNVPDSIATDSGTVTAGFCDIYMAVGEFPGSKNMNLDPQFVTGVQGYFYLDATSKSVSPCINAGSQFAGAIQFKSLGSPVSLAELSTDISGFLDTGLADTGFHYRGVTGPTATPGTPTLTPTPTPTLTPTPVSYGIVAGTLILDRPGQSPPSSAYAVPVNIWICEGGTETPYGAEATNDYGEFSFWLDPGTYTLRIKCHHSLSVVLEDVQVISGATTTIEAGPFPEGDADNSNDVLSSDFFILRSTYNQASGDVGFNENADFNEDDVVNSSDFFLLRGNYNTAGESCPVSTK